MRFLLTLTALFALTGAVAAPTGDCCSCNTPALGENEVGDGTPEHTFYLDDRGAVEGNGLWIYQESNGIFTPHAPSTFAYVGDDLQRGGVGLLDPVVPGGDKEICVDDPDVAPDTLIF